LTLGAPESKLSCVEVHVKAALKRGGGLWRKKLGKSP
jgi:hypothetical protein